MVCATVPALWWLWVIFSPELGRCESCGEERKRARRTFSYSMHDTTGAGSRSIMQITGAKQFAAAKELIERERAALDALQAEQADVAGDRDTTR